MSIGINECDNVANAVMSRQTIGIPQLDCGQMVHTVFLSPVFHVDLTMLFPASSTQSDGLGFFQDLDAV